MSDSLYLRYREAMYAQHFEQALDIIRSIAQRNPANAEAGRELRTTEQKVLDAHLARLEPLVQAGDEAAVLAAVARIEQLGLDQKPTGETWARAQVLRCRHQIQAAYFARQSGDWNAAATCLDDVATIRAHFPLVIADSDEAGLNETRAWVESCRAAKADAEKFAQETQHAQRLLASIMGRLAATAPIATNDLIAAHDELDRQGRATRAFDRPLPDGMDEQVSQTLDVLRSLIAGRQRRRRRNTILTAAVFCLIALVASLYFYAHREAQGAAASLGALMDGRDIGPAAELVRRLQQHPLAIGRLAVLQPKLAAAEKWLEREELARKDWRTNLVALRSLAAEGFAGSPPEAIENLLMSGRSSLTNLAREFRPELAATIAEIQSQWTAWQEKERREREKQFVPRLRAARQQAETELRYERGVEPVRHAVDSLESVVQDLATPATARLPGLRLSPAVLAEYEALRTRIATARKEVERWDEITTARQRLSSLEGYVEMLRRFQQSRFTPAPQAKAASVFLNQRISRNDLLGALLTPPGAPGSGDWVKAERQARSGFRPPAAAPAAVDKYKILRDDRRIHFLRRCALIEREKVGPLSKRVVFVEELGKSKTQRWRGLIYEPAIHPDELIFRPVEVDGYLTNLLHFEPAPELATYQKVGLDQFIDRDTSQTFTSTGLELLDRINCEGKGNPVFRAYLLQHTLDLMTVQADQWGWLWTPSLAEDLAALGELKLRSGDWLVPAVTNALGAKLGAHFNAASKRSYWTEATFLSQLSLRAADRDFAVVGSVDAAGDADLPSSEAGEWWGWSTGGNPALLFRRSGRGQPPAKLESAMPFSPLLTFRADRHGLIEEVAKATKFPLQTLGPLLQWPPLFGGIFAPAKAISLPSPLNLKSSNSSFTIKSP